MNAESWRAFRLLRTLLGPLRRPEPTRACPTLDDLRQPIEPGVTDMGFVSLAAIRRAREGEQS